MKEKITPYLKKLLEQPEIYNQYVDRSIIPNTNYTDPLNEDEHEVVKGLVHKYDNRALIKVSYQCAAHCRFCTRIRQIGDPKGTLNDDNIEAIVQYLIANPHIDDMILSGGDPLYTPLVTEKLLRRLREIDSVKILRIGSRLALQSPQSIYAAPVKRLLELIDETGKQKPFFLLLHINSPKELTAEVEDAISYLRSLKVTLLSQTVFLKNVNDNFDTLYELYQKLYHMGVIPYYLYHCDAVDGLEDFAVDLQKEMDIAKKLHQTLSGIACPRFVIDVENGYGKIPVPLDFIDHANGTICDFKNDLISIEKALT